MLDGERAAAHSPPVTDLHQHIPRPRVHHLDRDVAVANTAADVRLTTSGTLTRLTAEQARAVGWALIEAAEAVEPVT